MIKLYKVLETEENQFFCADCIGQTLKGQPVGEYVVLENGIKILAYNVKEVPTVMVEYSNHNLHVYTTITLEDYNNISMVKVKNAIANKVLQLAYADIPADAKKVYLKNIKKMIYEGTLHFEDDKRYEEVKGDFFKKAHASEDIILYNSDGTVKHIKAEKFNSKVLDNVYINKEFRSYWVYYKGFALFNVKYKNMVDAKIQELTISKIENTIDNTMVKLGLREAHTEQQLVALLEELGYSIKSANRRLERADPERLERIKSRLAELENKVTEVKNKLALLNNN